MATITPYIPAILTAFVGPTFLALGKGIAGGFRQTITWESTIVQGELPEQLRRELGTTMHAEKLVITNRGLRHLTNVQLSSDIFGKVWTHQVQSTTSVDKDSVVLRLEDNALRIAIPELPRGERIAIDLVALGHSGWVNRIRGGTSTYVIKNSPQWQMDRAMFTFYMFATLLFSVGLSMAIFG